MVFFSWLGKSNNNQKKRTLRSLNTSREGGRFFPTALESRGDCLLATQGKRRETLRLLSTRIPFCAAQGSSIASNASITPFHGMRLSRSEKKEKKTTGSQGKQGIYLWCGCVLLSGPKMVDFLPFCFKTRNNWYLVPSEKENPTKVLPFMEMEPLATLYIGIP